MVRGWLSIETLCDALIGNPARSFAEVNQQRKLPLDVESLILMRMSLAPALHPDLLRAFVLIAEGRSFTQAAPLVGRTQAAVSMQIKRLEEALGQPVLSRGKGEAVELTPRGQYLLGRARQMLALNDEVMATFRTPQFAGTVRLGTPDDYAFGYLPLVLKRFADTHPAVLVDVLREPSGKLLDRLHRGELDLTLLPEGTEPRSQPAVPLWRGPLVWVTSARHAPHRIDPLPLALASPDPLSKRRGCDWGCAAMQALERAGRRYRIAYTSASQVGTHAPVLAGLAVTVSALAWLPDGLRPMGPEEGLPQLPEYGVIMVKGCLAWQPVTDALTAHITETWRIDTRRNRAAEATSHLPARWGSR